MMADQTRIEIYGCRLLFFRVYPRKSAVKIPPFPPFLRVEAFAADLRALEQSSRSLSAANAHGHHAIAMLAPLHLIGHGSHHA
jgi:hypothetical protein